MGGFRYETSDIIECFNMDICKIKIFKLNELRRDNFSTSEFYLFAKNKKRR